MGDDLQPRSYSQGSQEPSFSQASLDLDALDDGNVGDTGGPGRGGGSGGTGGPGLAKRGREDMGISSQSSQEVPQCLLSQPSDDSQPSSQSPESGRTARVTFCCAPTGSSEEAPASPELVNNDKASPRITFNFLMQQTGPYVVSQFGWGGPSVSSTAEIELPVQIAGRVDAGALQSVKLEIPRWGDFVLQAVIVRIKDEQWCWTHHTRPQFAHPSKQNDFSELIFSVDHVHRCVNDTRNFVDNGCFNVTKQPIAAQGGSIRVVSQNSSSSQSSKCLAELEELLGDADGFSWVGGWVEQLKFQNSGRVVSFQAHGRESSLAWPTQPLAPGNYKVSMWVCVDDTYVLRLDRPLAVQFCDRLFERVLPTVPLCARKAMGGS